MYDCTHALTEGQQAGFDARIPVQLTSKSCRFCISASTALSSTLFRFAARTVGFHGVGNTYNSHIQPMRTA